MELELEFEWDAEKEAENVEKHGISFEEAMKVFDDKKRIIQFDPAHSGVEDRWFCIGKTSKGVLTVRFTLRENKIRIIGAGLWRKERRIYEERNR